MFLLHSFREITGRSGLLDQEDLYLLDEVFARTRIKIFLESSVLFLWTIMLCFVLIVLIGLNGFLTLAFIFTINILPSCLYTLVCWKIAVKFDGEIRKFFFLLREREICLFGVNNRKSGLNPTKCYKKQRQICLEKMRVNIKLLVETSQVLAIYRNESEKLLINFINDDLKRLCALNNLPGTIAPDDLDEEFLQIGSLKNCWQFMFLVRSEFIRLSIVSLLDFNMFFNEGRFVFAGSRVSLFFTLICMISKTFWLLFKLNLDLSTNMIAKPKQVALAESGISGYQSTAATGLSSLDSCIIQVEWVLENLQAAHQDIPSDPTALIACLQNVVSMMSTTTAASNEPVDVELEDNSSDSFFEEDIGVNLKLEDNLQTGNEYQIFEVDHKTETPTPLTPEWHSNVDGFNDLSTSKNKPLMQELKIVMEQRKEECIKKEITALAKCRKVPVEEIRREELERDLFGSTLEAHTEKSRNEKNAMGLFANQQQTRMPQVSRPVFGDMPSASDLQSILRHRHNVLRGSATGEAAKEDVFGCDEEGETT